MARKKKIVIFPNTTATEITRANGDVMAWRVMPDAGYILHEETHDEEQLDESYTPTGKIIKGYTREFITVGCNYDFEKNPRAIYAVLESEIESDSIIHGEGVTAND